MALQESLAADLHGLAGGFRAGGRAQGVFVMANAQLGRGIGRSCNAQYSGCNQISIHVCSPWLWTDIIARPSLTFEFLAPFLAFAIIFSLKQENPILQKVQLHQWGFNFPLRRKPYFAFPAAPISE
jgi:hypothetical protein